MKFTEEQYQRIVEIWNDEVTYKDGAQSVTNFIVKIGSSQYEKALAIANPLTREWAHDKFVEKEKKSHFVLKDVRDDNGNLYHLIEVSGAVMLNTWLNSGYHPKIKESDVRKWGFNPDVFDREEVQ
ncbi:hypothetical protein [Leuconostoc falkenbergense]|uniref:hypothetical protein n=1 Tax=Leuconostoc falkenbergense TaxID=2766470 RepID=UPI0039ECB571